MIFANRKLHDLDFSPKIFSYEIEKKENALFLGVIINENLTWKEHTLAIRAKMSRYVGILYKLKNILPLNARKNIFHSFIQSHLNYCSLIWGLGAKSNVEPLFIEQKKAVRALMPGFNTNYYKNGNNPCHTKSFFTEHKIMTVQSIILHNIINFMHKYHNYAHYIPTLVSKLIAHNAPKPGVRNEHDQNWVACQTTCKFRNALSFKGPLFYSKYKDAIYKHSIDRNKNKNNATFTSFISFKKYAKSFVFSLQTCGNYEEWEGSNMPLYYVPGLQREHRKNIPVMNYREL